MTADDRRWRTERTEHGSVSRSALSCKNRDDAVKCSLSIREKRLPPSRIHAVKKANGHEWNGHEFCRARRVLAFNNERYQSANVSGKPPELTKRLFRFVVGIPFKCRGDGEFLFQRTCFRPEPRFKLIFK